VVYIPVKLHMHSYYIKINYGDLNKRKHMGDVFEQYDVVHYITICHDLLLLVQKMAILSNIMVRFCLYIEMMREASLTLALNYGQLYILSTLLLRK
jgi:hypothetical protein